MRRAARIDGECFSCAGDLLNISASGAMIATAYPPRPGRHVTLICDEVDAIARVVWVGERSLGLAFDAHLPAEQVSRMIEAAL